MPTARIYGRVSGQRQAQEGYSLAAQRDKSDRWCDFQKLDARAYYEDAGISGRTLERPGLEQLLDDIEPGDTIIVYSLSRLGRGGAAQTLTLIERIQKMGARLISLTENIDSETPTGKLMLTILAGIAELEAEITRERAEMGRLEAARSGVYPSSSLPYGFMRDAETKTILEHPIHADVVRLIFDLAPGRSLPAVKRELETRNIPSPKGKTWSTAHLSSLIKNTTLTGIASYLKDSKSDHEIIPVQVPMIVTPDQFARAQRNGTNQGAKTNPDRYPLTGHLQCACGTPVSGMTHFTRHRKDVPWYKTDAYACPPAFRENNGVGQKCPSFNAAAPRFKPEPLHDQARTILARVLTDPQDPFALRAVIRPSKNDPFALERARLIQRLETLIDMRANAEITAEQLRERRAPIAKRLAELDQPEQLAEPLEEMPELARAILEGSNLELAEFLNLLDVRFKINPDRVTLELIQYRPLSDRAQRVLLD